MAPAAPSQPSVADIISAGMKYGPNAGLAIQRSQYLANALQSLESSASQNIRTPTALWSNLLADGITQWSKNKADREAMTAYSSDRAAQDAAILKGLQSPDVGAPAVPPAEAAPGPVPAAPAVPPAAVGPVQIGGPPPSPPPATSKSPTPDQIKLAQMVWGEARGEPPEGQQAVAAVAMNRLKKQPGATLADVLDAPHQFEGLTPKARAQTPDKLASILANIQPELNGADPTGGAVNFYAPALQAQLGRPAPAWATGQGQTIGHQQFFGGNPQMAQAATAHPPLMGGNPQAPRPDGSPQVQPAGAGDLGAMGMGAQPFASPPPAPVTPQAGAPPAAMPASPGVSAAGGAAPPMAGPAVPPMPQLPPQATPQGPHGVPTGSPPTPGEMAHLRTLLASPMTHEEGVAYGEALQRRMVSPIEAPKNMMWGANGQAVPIPGTQTTQLPGASPSDAAQRDPFGVVSHSSIPGVQGAVPEGMVSDGHGGYSHVPTTQQQTFRIPGANGVFITGPDGRPVKVADDQYGPSELLKMRDNLLGSEPVKLYQQSADAYGSMVAAAKLNPGGMRAYALRDTFARAINPGAVARVGTIQAIKESQGLPAEIKGFFMNLHGDGNVPPEIAQQILDVTHGFVASHYRGAQQLVQSNVDYAQRHKIDPADVTVPLGDAPQRFAIPVAKPPAPGAHPETAQAAAVAAEIARRRAAGTWTGH